MKKNRIFLLLALSLVMFNACNQDDGLPIDPVTEVPDNSNPGTTGDLSPQMQNAIEVQEIIQNFRETGVDIPSAIAEGIGLQAPGNNAATRSALPSGVRPEQMLPARLAVNISNFNNRFEGDSIPPEDDIDDPIDPEDSVWIDDPEDSVWIDDPADSTDWDDDDWDDDLDSIDFEYPECLSYESWVNEDSSYTMVTDFGDGCDVWGEFLKGKIIETFFEEDGIFKSRIEYRNFGGEDWQVNGVATHWGNCEITIDPVTGEEVFAASWNWEQDLSYVWTEDGQQFEANIASAGEAFADAEKFMIVAETQDVSYTIDGESDSYSSQVLEPLTELFSCFETDTYIWVAGVELVKSGEEEATFDYGDGTCDNIYTVTVGDEIIEVDLDDEDEDDQSGD